MSCGSFQGSPYRKQSEAGASGRITCEMGILRKLWQKIEPLVQLTEASFAS
jgi:hypothetical protein